MPKSMLYKRLCSTERAVPCDGSVWYKQSKFLESGTERARGSVRQVRGLPARARNAPSKPAADRDGVGQVERRQHCGGSGGRMQRYAQPTLPAASTASLSFACLVSAPLSLLLAYTALLFLPAPLAILFFPLIHTFDITLVSRTFCTPPHRCHPSHHLTSTPRNLRRRLCLEALQPPGAPRAHRDAAARERRVENGPRERAEHQAAAAHAARACDREAEAELGAHRRGAQGGVDSVCGHRRVHDDGRVGASDGAHQHAQRDVHRLRRALRLPRLLQGPRLYLALAVPHLRAQIFS
eukprot:268411-Rhodomonas_salina.1